MKHIILLIAALTMLSACGVKPSGVDGKEGHPRVYPDIHHDPLPNGGPAATTIR